MSGCAARARSQSAASSSRCASAHSTTIAAARRGNDPSRIRSVSIRNVASCLRVTRMKVRRCVIVVVHRDHDPEELADSRHEHASVVPYTDRAGTELDFQSVSSSGIPDAARSCVLHLALQPLSLVRALARAQPGQQPDPASRSRCRPVTPAEPRRGWRGPGCTVFIRARTYRSRAATTRRSLSDVGQPSRLLSRRSLSPCSRSSTASSFSSCARVEPMLPACSGWRATASA